MTVFHELLAFIAEISQDQYLPQAKLVADIIIGLIAQATPRLADIARWLAAYCGRRAISTAKRLASGLRSSRFRDVAMRQRITAFAGGLLPEDGAGVVVAIDDTHIEKPWANPSSPAGQQHAARVLAASNPDKTTTYGYAMVHLVASRPDALEVPLVANVWSTDAPGYVSPWHTTLAAIDEARPHVGPAALWVFDRGYDAATLFVGLDERELRWIVRVKARRSRKVVLANGEVANISTLWSGVACAMKLRLPQSRLRYLQRGVQVGLAHIRLLTERGEAQATTRTLVVVRRPDADVEPWVLLVGFRVGPGNVSAIVDAYSRRWAAETAHRRSKNERGWGPGLQMLQVLRYRSVRRLAWLVHAVEVFVAHLLARRPALVQKLCFDAGIKKKGTKDLAYRLYRGLGAALRRKRPLNWRSLRIKLSD